MKSERISDFGMHEGGEGKGGEYFIGVLVRVRLLGLHSASLALEKIASAGLVKSGGAGARAVGGAGARAAPAAAPRGGRLRLRPRNFREHCHSTDSNDRDLDIILIQKSTFG